MGIPHVLAIPYPGQGHVIPMIELMQRATQHGLKVTIANAEFIHTKVMNALSTNEDLGENLNLVSIPDGMEPGEDRNDILKVSQAIQRFMPKELEEFIQKINGAGDDDKISCVIVDGTMGFAVNVAKNLGIKVAVVWFASAAVLVSIQSIPKLIDDGILNKDDGSVTKNKMFPLSVPTISSETLMWTSFNDEAIRKNCFELLSNCNQSMKLADLIICNSAYELEPAAFSAIPKVLPVGPLSASSVPKDKAGNFWSEDSSCLSWLDQQPVCSVIYVAFGSFTIFDQTQFQELALGLELTNRPFLWVVRPDITTDTHVAYPDGFQDRVGIRGKMVGWAPQHKVLRHPSVACFLSHCGWNSTTEGVSNGVPFLCWPYFADQLSNETYICDVWNIGLGFKKDAGGIIRQDEIVRKVEQLFSGNYKERAMELKLKVLNSVQAYGCSEKNLSNFIKWMK
ncbi:putative UDP-glucuronosyl/UDP-glucosyltransferase [Heracleum sosnowskyi]|uniref:UDP-glucuronosyl/UDP-glucosyltransferase n=1 Tax=Heracleum sosnowskyi TaxID=360622 RepID=A0AAD8MAL7_9APIA|nr:putative UDP-glucuronosyl/UDP-glucosyltransferase [Heracleum sosnowskyi]